VGRFTVIESGGIMRSTSWRFAVVVLLLSATYARADSVTEISCDVLATGTDGKVHTIFEGANVLEPTRIAATFSIAIPDGYYGASIRCERTDLVPAENDWKVLRAGFPLYIHDTITSQLGTLELIGGQFRFRAVAGNRMSPDQMARMQARLDQLQTTMDTADTPASVKK
jgi:hypothetical protein